VAVSWHLLCALTFAPQAHAGSILDYIRNYDLNDYALGLAYSVTESPYLGGANSSFAYPYLTSFNNDAFTDDWLILSNGDIGARWVNDSGWVLGAVARIRTQGTGTKLLDQLENIDVRKWTVEAGPLVGWRRWPLHFELKQYYEIFSSFSGPTGELGVSLPAQFPWGWFVPTVSLVRNSAAHNRYYYGVSESESNPDLPSYEPGASLNVRAGISVGYEIRQQWLLTASVAHEWLGTEIKDSPIVDKTGTWSGNVGIAYNNDIFHKRGSSGDAFRESGFELRAGLYQSDVDSTIVTRPTGSDAPEEVDVEDVLGVNRRKSVLHIAGILRVARFHRIEVDHFTLGRTSNTTLLTDVTIGDETFPAGTEVDIEADLRVTKVAYGFSLMNDKQKELGIIAGFHVTDFEAKVTARDSGVQAESSLSTPLPVIGLFGSVALGPRTDLSANVQIFRMEFDNYSGSLNSAYFGVTHYFSDTLGAGVGYNAYLLGLDSPEQDLRGTLKIRHYGPIVFASVRF